MPLRRGAAQQRSLLASWALRVGTAAALAIDAAVHLRNASAYDAVTATISQGALFRVKRAWRSPPRCWCWRGRAAVRQRMAPLARFEAGVGEHPAQVDDHLSVEVLVVWRL